MPGKYVAKLEERCQAFVFDMYGKKIKGRCRNKRHYVIGGKELCARHTALEAFHILLTRGEVKELQHIPPPPYGAVRTEWQEGR